VERIAVVNGTVLTMNPAREIVAGGSVLMEKGRIREVRPGGAPVPEGFERIDATGCVVMPGLINAHTHLYQMFGRSLSFDQNFVQWLATQKGLIAQLDEDDFGLCIELGLVLNLRSGNTCVVDNLAVPAATGNRLYRAALERARRYGLAYVLARGYTDRMNSSDYLEDLGTIEDRVRELIEEYHDRRDSRLRVFVSPMLPWALSPEGYRLTRKLANQYDVGIHMHTAETDGYAGLIERAFGHRSNIRVYRDGDCLGRDVQLLGCQHLTDEEYDEIARTGTRVILDPTSGMNLGTGDAPTVKVYRNGNPTALATNGMASAGGQDMFDAMRNVVSLARLQTRQAETIGAARALDMATIEGATALGLEREIGSLEPGKRADVICVDISRIYCAPALDVPATVVFSCSSRDVRTVIVNGRVAVRDFELVLADERALTTEARERAQLARERAAAAAR
jgi:5-methylthioadenosine/S-adenosylhomocysteine deaminase